MPYWIAIPVGLALGLLLFFLAYWSGKREGRRRGRRDELATVGRLVLTTQELMEACKAQHDAIDLLFARLIQLDSTFFPSRSGKPWEALQLGVTAMCNVEKRWREKVDSGGHTS